MKIVAPASSLEEIREYNKIGIEEIYLGLNELPSEEKQKNKWDTVNERFEPHASFSSFDSIKEANRINASSAKPAELSLVLNKSFYNEDQLKRVKEQIMYLKDYVDNFIISDVSLIKFIKENAPNNGIILSCLSVCQNSSSVRFYKKQGIKKIILPRHLTLNEIEDITENNKDIEFEMMILNQFCRNIDGFCSRCHIPSPGEEKFKTVCNLPYKNQIHFIKEGKERLKELIEENISNVTKKFNPFCGICFLKKLEGLGVTHLKIVGRTNSLQRKINDARFIKKAISLMNLPQEEFEEKCKELFKDYYQFKCENNCYY
jgi:putative protease